MVSRFKYFGMKLITTGSEGETIVANFPRFMGMMIIGIVLIIAMSWSVSAQQPMENSPLKKVESSHGAEGKITIKQSPAIEQLLNKHVQWNMDNPGVEGFRIQLFSGTGAQSRQEAREVRTRLMSLLPEEAPILEYNAPFWRVRVGSFRHKHEALPLLNKLKSSFPNSFIVRDPNIKPAEFN